MKRALAVTAVVLVATALAGCDYSLRYSSVSPSFVNPGDVAAYPAGSPQRAFIEAIRSMQYGDATLAATYADPSLNLTTARMARFLPVWGPLLAVLGEPRLTGMVRHGNIANVFFPYFGVPKVAIMHLVGGTWRMLLITSPGVKIHGKPPANLLAGK